MKFYFRYLKIIILKGKTPTKSERFCNPHIQPLSIWTAGGSAKSWVNVIYIYLYRKQSK